MEMEVWGAKSQPSDLQLDLDVLVDPESQRLMDEADLLEFVRPHSASFPCYVPFVRTDMLISFPAPRLRTRMKKGRTTSMRMTKTTKPLRMTITAPAQGQKPARAPQQALRLRAQQLRSLL